MTSRIQETYFKNLSVFTEYSVY